MLYDSNARVSSRIKAPPYEVYLSPPKERFGARRQRRPKEGLPDKVDRPECPEDLRRRSESDGGLKPKESDSSSGLKTQAIDG